MGLGNIWRFSYITGTNGGAAFVLIYLLEVIVAWLVDEKGWSRVGAAVLMGIAIFLMGIPCTLGYNLLGNISFLGMDILDTYDFEASDILLPLGGLMTAIFVGYVWTSKRACQEMNTPECAIFVGTWYGFLIRYIVPVPIAVIMIVGLYQKFTG